MNLLLDIAQGIGVAAGAGIRPFLPALLVGALATGDLGVDFEGTDYAFLESGWFLLVLFVGAALAVLAERRLGSDAFDAGPPAAAMAGMGIGLGALLFAGSLADRGHESWPGLAGGVAVALLASSATRGLFARTRQRLDPEARAALGLYAELSALVIAGLSVLVPPAGPVALGFLAWLLLTGRRRGGEKYAGLRVLR